MARTRCNPVEPLGTWSRNSAIWRLPSPQSSMNSHRSRDDALPGCVTVSSRQHWKGATVEVCRHEPATEVRLCYAQTEHLAFVEGPFGALRQA
jgi:hypothetical protein